MGNEILEQEYPGGTLVRPAVIKDAQAVASNMRDADRREMAALGLSPIHATTSALLYCKVAYAVVHQDEPVLIFGVSDSNIEGMGSVWAMGTYQVKEIARTFLRHSREWVDRIGDGYDYIGNIVDERNAVHIRWLKWCGFEFGHTIHYGPLGLPFTNFIRQV